MTSSAGSRRSPARGRGQRLLARVASAPWAAHDALDIAFSLIKESKLWLIGAIAYWTFDIATLWACFHAFGSPPTVAVIVMAYFVGTLANSLPLPGGLGGVEAGMSARLPRVRHPRQARDPRRPLLPPHLLLVSNAPRRSGIPPTPSHRQHLEKRHKRTQARNQFGASHLTRRGDAFLAESHGRQSPPTHCR